MKINKLTFAATAAAIMLILMSYNPRLSFTAAAQSSPYKSCEEDKLTAPLTLQPVTAATQAATTTATMAATEPSATTGADDIVFLSIVGSESQACYLTTETFLAGNNMGLPTGFNGAVGITHTIQGDIALDRTNVANSQIGDITINISEFKSDNDRRDSFIRRQFLESNKYPYATLTGATAIGLPTGAYQDGTALQFQIKGALTVHNTPRETTFNAMGSFTGGTLVVRATVDLKMSDFGIEVPNIGGLLKADDAMRLVVNVVARESQGTATPAQ